MAYGQTGAGKTHTMTGATVPEPCGAGLVPRSVRHVFAGLRERGAPALGAAHGSTGVRASYCEIYGDVIIDLLAPAEDGPEWGAGGREQGRRRSGPPLHVAEDPSSGEVTVIGLRHIAVSDATAALALLAEGDAARAVASHALNARSTRAHSIFTLYLEQRAPVVRQGSVRPAVARSKLHLVDLAGSERVSRTGSAGAVLREAGGINRSLSALEHVVRSLGARTRPSHVPFRSSKLTAALRDTLGGNCRTAVVVCLWPAASHSSETARTVRFAGRLLRVRTRPLLGRPELRGGGDDDDDDDTFPDGMPPAEAGLASSGALPRAGRKPALEALRARSSRLAAELERTTSELEALKAELAMHDELAAAGRGAGRRRALDPSDRELVRGAVMGLLSVPSPGPDDATRTVGRLPSAAHLFEAFADLAGRVAAAGAPPAGTARQCEEEAAPTAPPAAAGGLAPPAPRSTTATEAGEPAGGGGRRDDDGSAEPEAESRADLVRRYTAATTEGAAAWAQVEAAGRAEAAAAAALRSAGESANAAKRAMDEAAGRGEAGATAKAKARYRGAFAAIAECKDDIAYVRSRRAALQAGVVRAAAAWAGRAARGTG